MGIKFDTATKTYVVSYSKRHPITNQPVTLRRVGVPTEPKAKRVLEELIAKVSDKIRQEVVPTWEKLVEEFYGQLYQRGLANSTVYNGRLCVDHYTKEVWRKKTIDQIRTDDIRQIIDVRMRDKKPSYQKYFYRCMRQLFLYAIEKGYIHKNPVPVLKFKVADKIKAVLTEEQAKTLLAEAKKVDWDWYPHYAVALYTGMRSGELYALTWDKVDLERRTILVNCSWSSKDGYKSTKSGDDRIVDVSPALLPLLRELKIQSDGHSWVLPRSDRWDRGQQAKDLRMFLQAIRLPQIRFHDLRATWATIMLSKGVQPAKVMAMGGWRDMETMMIYFRKAGLDIKGASECLNLTLPETEAKVIELPRM